MSAATSRYLGQRASLATLHDKVGLVAPDMRCLLGLEVFGVAVDTDQFGTFSGERPRRDTPRVTAEKKARAGMHATGVARGLATEGSISVDGLLPVARHDEIVVFVDDDEGFTLWESATSHDIVAHRLVLTSGYPSDADLTRAGFPDHGVIVRSSDLRHGVTKGIHSCDELTRAIDAMWSAGVETVTVESDLRAHHCPSRRPTIQKAARRLAERLRHECPSCRCPGWGVVDVVRGRRCAWCRLPTRERLATVHGCARCEERRNVDVVDDPIDPSLCDHCNP